MKKTKLLVYVVALLAVFTAKSQTYLMNNTPVTDCEGAFYDSGGGSGNYGNNQNFTKKFCADGTVGTHVQLNFSGVELSPGDDLCFYDGPNASAPQLSCSSDFPPGEPFIVQATAQNPSGCLTVTFNSNGSGTGAGWAAAIKCVAACQTVLADLVSTMPALIPADTGWIDVCPDERIFLSGRGEYPQNGVVYQQSDFNTTFEWNFGDGAIGYGPNTSHRFSEPGGYYIQLLLTDTFKCRSTNLLNLRVRVAPRPNFDLSNANTTPICAGDTIHLSSSVNGNNGAALIATPDTSNFAIEGIRSDSLPLPDGNGQSYETSIFFTEFSPGQVVTNASDIESICVNMEHSWMRDMRIKLTCPNGDTIGLHNFAGQTGGSVFLGEPNDTDTGLNPIPGVGYDYCWTANATNGTWLQYANTVLGGSGTLPPGDYSPVDPFDDLVGCPLNGEWKITVTDLWAYDNGYIFSWSIKIKEDLYPSIEAFSPQFVNWGWNPQPTIFYQNQDSIAATPQNAGTANFTFSVTDEFGCIWNEPVNIPVLPPTHPDCHSCNQAFTALRDTAVCAGSAVELNAVSLLPPQQEVRFEAFPDYAFGYANHPPLNPYASALAVNSMGYNFLTDPVNQITEVCLDLETDFDADIQLYLRSPDGKILELSTGNGGSGDNYKTTCFSPTAITPIVGQTAPFNGTYQPEGNWTSLSGAVVNGDWQLLAADNGGPTKLGRLKGWNIGFVFNNSFSYDWTNSVSLSCDFCPAPVAMPAATTNYVVSITDAFGCLHLDTATVDISTVFPAPTNIDFINQPGGVMTWTWTPVQGATGYEVQIDGGPWEPANGMNAHTVTGLATGQFVLFKIRAAGGSPSCVPDEEQSLGEYFECVLDAYLNSTVDALCYGAPTGTAYISVSNANIPVSYFANGLLPAYANGDLVNIFPAGNHFVIVADATACQDTVYFTIGEPGPISVSASSMDAVCNGQPSGSVSATAMGGVGSFNYNWETCAGAAVGSSAMLPNL
ncbi:MAG: proprotein convertase P-domain-containing protein, partial [Saprospiraceae bacterium]|nr:proprotein convertase P-domain-containing protein [Saprospiraceae bacterium]